MTTLWLPCLQKQQVISVLNKTRDTYNVQLQKGNKMVLKEEAQAETARRSENDTNDIQETHTEHATVQNVVWTQSVFQFNPG
jgi:hypothetical protein